MIFKKYLGRVHRGKKENENYPDIANVLICTVTDFFPINTFIHVLIFVKIGLYFTTVSSPAFLLHNMSWISFYP